MDTTVDWSGYKGGIAAAETLDADVRRLAEQAAWETLTYLSGGQIRDTPIVVRPAGEAACCRGSWPTVLHRDPEYPWLGILGSWRNRCGCSRRLSTEVRLPGPISRIVEVRVAGTPVSPGAYRVDNGYILVREDGFDWPHGVNNGRDDDPDAFVITYYRGVAPSARVRFAAGMLAGEFAAALNGGPCALPKGTRSVTRQGVSIEIDTAAFPNNRTNIRIVDALIASINPHGLRSESVVMSPDLPRMRQTTIAAPRTGA
jgi:hypothetical protein